MIHISYASEKDTPQVKRLWTEAFGEEMPYTGWYFHNIYRPERCLCLYEADNIVSCLQYAPYKMQFLGKQIPVAYLVGVCTDPSYQHKGYARHLLAEIDADLAKQYRLLLLYTDIPAFYQPLGFCHCYRLNHMELPARFDPGQKKKWRSGTLSYQDIAEYDRIYTLMTADMDGFIRRTPANWLNFLGDFLCDEGALFRKDDAYLLWCMDNGKPRVKELGYGNAAAIADGLSLAAHLAAARGYDSFIWDAPLSAPLPPGITGKIMPYVMAKLCGSREKAEETAQNTQDYLYRGKHLWINEMT